MSKRQTFYARADLFKADISHQGKLVLSYLSSVSNRQGVSFPSVPTGLGEVRHLLRPGALVEPRHHLIGAEAGLAPFGHEGGDALFVEVHQIHRFILAI